MDSDYDNDEYGSWSAGRYTLHVIVGAIVVGIIILLFIWLLPFIGFIFTALLVVLLIFLVIWGIIWLVRQVAAGGRRRHEKRTKSCPKQE